MKEIRVLVMPSLIAWLSAHMADMVDPGVERVFWVGMCIYGMTMLALCTVGLLAGDGKGQ